MDFKCPECGGHLELIDEDEEPSLREYICDDCNEIFERSELFKEESVTVRFPDELMDEEEED